MRKRSIPLLVVAVALALVPALAATAQPTSTYRVWMSTGAGITAGSTLVNFGDGVATTIDVFVGCERWTGTAVSGTAGVSGHAQLAVDVVVDGTYSNCGDASSNFTGLTFSMAGSPIGSTSRTRNPDGSRTLVTSMALSRSFGPLLLEGGTGEMTEVISR